MGTTLDTGQSMRVPAPAVLPAHPPMPERASVADGCPPEIPCRSVTLTEQETAALLAKIAGNASPARPSPPLRSHSLQLAPAPEA
jgi:hypothetical protein